MQELAVPRKGVWFYLRIVTSVLIFVYIFSKVGWSELYSLLQKASLNYLLISILIAPILILTSCWKWQVILKAQSIRVPLGKLFWLYIVGYFFNMVLPSNVGGDVVRAWSLGKHVNNQAEAFSSVFIERFTGLTALLLMAILAFFAAIHNLWNIWVNLALLISILGYFSILFLLLQKTTLQFLLSRWRIKFFRKFLLKVEKFQSALLSISSKKSLLVFTMANSFLFYIIAVFNVYFTAKVFQSSIGIVGAFIITPIVLVITMIPISVGGLGLSEGAYFFTFERMALGGPVGLSVALLMRAKAMLAGIIGGIYYSSLGTNLKNTGKDISQENICQNGDQKLNYFSSFEGVMRQKKSPIKKYQEIVMGTGSFIKLLKFDLITSLFGPMPGIGGLLFRKIFFQLLFKKVGAGCIWGRSISLRHSQKIEIGKQCVFDEYCALSAQGDVDSSIKIGDEVLLGRGTIILTRNGKIVIDDFCNIGSNCRLGTTTNLKLGKHVLIAANCYIGGAQHNFNRTDIPIMKQGYRDRGGIVIEDDVWLGANVTVFDGVKIGTGAVIGAGSVVTKDIPPYSIAMGIPAKVTGSRKDK